MPALKEVLGRTCPACGNASRAWRPTYCERRCVASPLARTSFTHKPDPAFAPEPHLHLECHECGYTVLAPPADVGLTVAWRYGGADGPSLHREGRA